MEHETHRMLYYIFLWLEYNSPNDEYCDMKIIRAQFNTTENNYITGRSEKFENLLQYSREHKNRIIF